MPVTINPWTRRDLWVLIGLLLIAGALRFARLDITDYHYDQATLVGMGQDFLSGKHFPDEGLPASVGFPAPPTMDFLIALPYLVSSNPLFAESCIVVLNLIGIALLYWIAQRYFSKTAALLAGLAYGCSPWAILYSREIWPPHFVTPFVLASITCGLIGFVEGKRWGQVLCLPLLSIAISSHYGVTALITVFAWFLWKKRASRRAVALSLAITLIMLIPFIPRFTGSSIGSIETAITQHGSGDRSLTSALAVIARFSSGAGVERAFGLPSASYTDQVPLIFWIVAAIPALIGLAAARRHPLAPMIYLWAFSALAILTVLPVATNDHYLVTCIPALCLLAGIGLEVALTRLHPAVLIPWAAILAVQCALWFLLLGDARTIVTQDFGPPLTDLLPIRQQLSSANDLIIVGGMTGISGSDVWSTMLFGTATCVRELIIADGGIAVLPAHPFDLVLAPGAADPGAPYITTRQLHFPIPQGEYTIEPFNGAVNWAQPAITSIAPAKFANSVSLIGYTFSSGRLYLEWGLPGQSDQDYHYFAHVLDANGSKLAQHDASFWPGVYWCAGDRIITWYDLSQPADAATLRIGMYRLNHNSIRGVNVTDSAGSVSPWVDIPLKKAEASS